MRKHMHQALKNQKSLPEIKPRILLHEQDLLECRETAQKLNELYEFEACTTKDFDKKLNAFKPDVAILNDTSAQSTGIHLLDRIKEENSMQHVKVLIIKEFGNNNYSTTKRVADGYLSKPLNCDSLEKWLARTTNHKRNSIVFWSQKANEQ